MDKPSPQKLSSDREKVIEKLVKGREFASQLRILLEDHGRSVSAEELLHEILRSFTDTLSVLTPIPIPASAQVDSPSPGDRTSGETSKKRAFKHRRGCYKRRKSTDSWMILSNTVDDGYAWRKYGQKEILNTKHPRCYFRCTNKKSEGCKAIKQVQLREQDPNIYQITYFGHHTCKETLMTTASDSNIPPVEPSYNMLNVVETNVQCSFKANTDHPSLKDEEIKEETQSNGLSDDLPWPFDPSMEWPDLTVPDSSRTTAVGSGHDDLISSLYSSASTGACQHLDYFPVDFDTMDFLLEDEV